MQSIMNKAEFLRGFVKTNKIESVCIASYILIFAGCFFMSTSCHRDILYFSLPFSLFYMWQNTALLKEAYAAYKYFILPFLAFLTFTGLSAFWSVPYEDGYTFNMVKVLFFLPVSMATLFLIVKRNPYVYDIIVYSFVASALITGIYLLGHNFITDSVERMEGLGRANNSVMGGYLYVLAILVAFFAKPMAIVPRQYKVLLFLVCFYVMILMLSRSSFIILGASAGILMLAKRQFKVIIALGLLVIVGGTAVYTSPYRDVIPVVNRLDMGRLQIWKGAIDKAVESPVWGHGIATKILYPVYKKDGRVEELAPHAHNFYLGSLVEGGIISLSFVLFFIAMMGKKAYGLALTQNEFGPLAVLVSCIFMGFLNFSSTINNLGVIWIALWYQYAIIMAMEKSRPVVE